MKKDTKGRPSIRWMDNIKREMREYGVDDQMTEDRKVWSNMVATVDMLVYKTHGEKTVNRILATQISYV